jgi:hypothetical protein
VILSLSYLFNIISALTASYLIFWLTKWLTGLVFIAYTLSAVFLFFMEKLKRKSSSEFFQVWFFEKHIATGWLALSLIMFGVSVASTYYGTDRATIDFAPSAPIITKDSILNDLYAQLDTTETQITKARKTKWKGTTTRTSQQTISELTKQKTTLLSDIRMKEKENKNQNNSIKSKHSNEIEITATTLSWVTVLFELLFECCMAYIWYYYYRSYIERKKTNNLPLTPNKEEIKHQSFEELFKHLQTAINHSQNGKVDHPQESNDYSKNGEANNQSILPLGFYTDSQRKEYLERLFKQQIQPFKQSFSEKEIILLDKYTISHRDFKNGEIKHLNMGNINNRIDIYTGRIKKAFDNDNLRVIPNQLSKLQYWINRRNELVKKCKQSKKQ